MNKELKVSSELLQAIVNYLGTKPFNEVHVLISEIMKCEPADGTSERGENRNNLGEI